jgi:hypothetical protein
MHRNRILDCRVETNNRQDRSLNAYRNDPASCNPLKRPVADPLELPVTDASDTGLWEVERALGRETRDSLICASRQEPEGVSETNSCR